MHDVLVFPSKVDAWFVAIFFFGAVAIAGGGVLAWRRKQRAIAVMLGVIGGGFVFAAPYMTFTLRYEVRADGSVGMPGGTMFNAHDVVAIAPSSDPRGCACGSLDRLRIDTSTGRNVLISPNDKPGFLAAVASYDSALHVEGDRVVRR